MARVRAPALMGRGGWIGAVDTFGLPALSGKVVLLDFFTSSCINCVRVQAEIRRIEETFPDTVAVIGIHSPKFPHEHEHATIERAIERLGIRHPVLDDPDLATWQQYGVKGWPTLVVIDPDGYVVGGIAGEGSGPVVTSTIEAVIRDFDAKGGIVRAPVSGMWNPSGMPPGFRTLAFPSNVAVAPDGRRLAISDTGNNRVVVCDLHGRVERVYPLLNGPRGLAFDGGRILVCDTDADRVIAIDRSSGEQSDVATGLASPWDLCVTGDSVLVTEAGRHRIWRVPPEGTPVVVAGTGQENLIDTGAESPVALLAHPSGIDLLPDGAAAFVDAESSALRILHPDGSVVTLVGQGLWDWGASDGGPDSSAMQHPLGVCVAGSSLIVADTLNGMLRAWDGTAWAAGAGALRTLPARGLEEPEGVAALPDGRLVVADTGQHRIVLVDPASAMVEPLLLDESWLGTAVGASIDVSPGGPIPVPFSFDQGGYTLDASAGPPVRIEITSDPGHLLAAGPRSWMLDEPDGTISVTAGRAGAGILVVDVAVSVCDDIQCTVLRAKSRHDLTVSEGAEG